MKHSPMSIVFVSFVLISFFWAAWTGSMEAVQEASFESAKSAVNLAISLIGVMAFWLGMMSVLEKGGLMKSLAEMLKPVMLRLFPDVPASHPAMSSMIMNISANMLGLGNAATPFGIKAMQELNKLNPFPGRATNAMCLFLAINTSSVALLPLGVIAVRSAAGASDPAAIMIPSFLATSCSTIVAIITARLFFKKEEVKKDLSFQEEEADSKDRPSAFWPVLFFISLAVVMAVHRARHAENIYEEITSFWLMPFLMCLILVYGVARRVQVYEAVTEGAKQGFEIAVKIIPYLVVILVSIGVLRASGALTAFETLFNPIGSLIGLPAAVLPLAILRPLSGSGAFAVMSATVSENPDSYEAFLASTMMGSTETTFYVLAVYFGAVGVSKIRYALVCALAADITGVIAACAFSKMFY